MEKKIITSSVEETEKLGEQLAKKLKGGEVLALFGDLGSGKTTFVKGLAKGLGAKGRIISPTFIIQNIHALKNGSRLYHFDLYRLENIDISTQESLKEALSDSKGISVIEWAEKLLALPKKTIHLEFEYLNETKRRIKING